MVYGLEGYSNHLYLQIDLKLKDLSKVLGKKCSTGCTITEDVEKKIPILQLQGDLISIIAPFLIKEYKV